MPSVIITWISPRNPHAKRGFTLIEVLVATAVLGIFFAAVTLILQQVLENIGYSRVRTIGLSLAQERMERVRNMPYADIGTISGIPPGIIASDETVNINSLDFTIMTDVQYIDDPYDGLAPADAVNTDYKRVTMTVTWGGIYPSRQPVYMTTDVAPPGLESDPGTDGTLTVKVFDATGLPVSNATVNIDNTSVTPEIHIQTLTDANGTVSLPGAPVCSACYEIRATKQNYSTDRTYSTAEVANPLLPHATVIDGDVTQISLAIDRVSSVTIQSLGAQENGYPPVGNVIFTLRGSKIIGYDVSDNPVFKYSYTTNTAGGFVGIPSLEWDTYTLDFTPSGHNFAGSNPMSPFVLPPATSWTVPISAVPKTSTSLLVSVVDLANAPVASASVRLWNESLSFDLTKYTAATGTPNWGHAFFGGLTQGLYGLQVTFPGLEEASRAVDLIGAIREHVLLPPSIP